MNDIDKIIALEEREKLLLSAILNIDFIIKVTGDNPCSQTMADIDNIIQEVL